MTLENHPNPFAVNTLLTYTLPAEGHVTLMINDMLGRTVKTLVNEPQSTGKHSVNLDASPLQPGVYFATVTLRNSSGELVRTIKIVRNR
jgi:flagellar hook assembly protein FlgD